MLQIRPVQRALQPKSTVPQAFLTQLWPDRRDRSALYKRRHLTPHTMSLCPWRHYVSSDFWMLCYCRRGTGLYRIRLLIDGKVTSSWNSSLSRKDKRRGRVSTNDSADVLSRLSGDILRSGCVTGDAKWRHQTVCFVLLFPKMGYSLLRNAIDLEPAPYGNFEPFASCFLYGHKKNIWKAIKDRREKVRPGFWLNWVEEVVISSFSPHAHWHLTWSWTGRKTED